MKMSHTHVSRLATFAAVVLATVSSARSAQPKPEGKSFTNSIGMKLVRIEPGSFMMGFGDKPLPKEIVTMKGHFPNADFDEHPTHQVRITRAFYMGVYEVTNAQYEQFDPAHKKLRGRAGFSVDDDEAVVFVSWNDAVRFCRWLGKKEGMAYRLPTEAQWEYACRAGTTTNYHTGDIVPKEFIKGNLETTTPVSTPLHVGRTCPNAWGLYDMHGNVEEWSSDWYGPYEAGLQIDPVGRIDGNFKVARGGSHSTEPYYLRSANRLGSLPEDRQWMTGFRVVLVEMPKTAALPRPAPQRFQQNVRQEIPSDVSQGPNPDKPYFKGPRLVVKIPEGSTGPLYWKHSHFMAVTECPNGDLLAAWFNCMEEKGRELSVAASRLRYGAEEWEPASLFWDAPDRNDHAHSLWHDGNGTLYHFNGLGTRWRNLAILLRKSTDNGVTWSKARLIFPGHDTGRHTVVESVFRAQNGQIVLPIDGRTGSIIVLSSDEGKTWLDPGGNIRGTHAGVTQLADGRLMAFGRHGAINGMLPKSISTDMGKTWTYSAGPFTSIHTGRRLALMRLEGGQLFCASFCYEMPVVNNTGQQHPVTGLFGALSLDEGRTWPYRRLLCGDGQPREIETMSGDRIMMDGSSGELYGYLSVCQGADGIIHLLSSCNHYAFNTKWLMTSPPPPPPPQPPPTARRLQVKKNLPNVYDPKGLPSDDNWQWELNGRGLKESELVSIASKGLLKIHTNDKQAFYFRTDQLDGFGAVDTKKGCTSEIKTQILKRKADNHGVAFELYDGAGSRYAISISDTGVYWYQGRVQKSALLPFSQYVPLVEGLNNADAMHTYRLAIRKGRVVQVYRDGKLIGVRRYEYRTPRFGYIFFGTGPGAQALVDYISYDLTGPYRP